jgi:hypothetical protein
MKPRTQTYSTRHLAADPLRPPAGSLSASVRAAPEPAAVLVDLRAQAEALGIAVNPRWTPARLRLEIAKRSR